MSYIDLSTNDRTFLLASLRKFDIKYSYKPIKIQKITGDSFDRKCADINKEHILKLLEEIKNQDDTTYRGHCRKWHNQMAYKHMKKLYKRFLGEDNEN